MKKANIVTFLNLAVGFLSLYFISINDFFTASILILAAVLFDYLDGKVARLLKEESKLGEELDSLADLISFGVAPAFFVIVLTQNMVVIVLGTFLVFSGAYRLAKFNLQKIKKFYIGMPITVNGVAFPVLYFLNANYIVYIVFLVLSIFLMASTIKIRKL